MPLALYYKPSYERLQERIHNVAPDLEVAIYDENGSIFYQGQEVTLKDIKPEYFWVHADLFRTKRMLEYFDVMQQCESIRWLHTINTGLDMLPYLPLLEKGVVITNNHGQAIAIAEYVFAQLLAWYQNVYDFRSKQLERLWKPRGFQEIQGSHWVLVGFGHIGQEIARRAKAFGVKITAVRRNQQTEGLADRVVPHSELYSVLPEADVVILACTANQATRNMVNDEFLGKMQESAVLVNVARGDLVNENHLHIALDAGKPGYAILDVFNQEPLPADSWFWAHPKVSLTPHTSNAGTGMVTRSVDTFLENLTRIEAGQPLINQVSKQDIV